MAKTPGFYETDALCKKIISDARDGNFAPVYLLMGDEPYYPELACAAILEHALQEHERDFNQSVFYGLDTDAWTVASEARSYPVMAGRRLVVFREAQACRTLEELASYCEEPMETTVLVILLHGAKADKRKALYKNAMKNGIVMDSNLLRDYEMERWIAAYYRERGLEIAPDAAAMLAEYAGTDPGRISVETDKMLRNLPAGTSTVSVRDIEQNVGISRQWSVFELTRALSYKDVPKALKVAVGVASAPKFFLPTAIAVLFNHFYRVYKLEAARSGGVVLSPDAKAAILGVNPFFFREYEAAASNYPMASCVRVLSMLEEYDYKGKGGQAGEAGHDDLLIELVTKICQL